MSFNNKVYSNEPKQIDMSMMMLGSGKNILFDFSSSTRKKGESDISDFFGMIMDHDDYEFLIFPTPILSIGSLFSTKFSGSFRVGSTARSKFRE